jgi:hypothetical protein
VQCFIGVSIAESKPVKAVNPLPQICGSLIVILLLRTYAIWENDKRVGLSLLAAFLASFAVQGFYALKFLSQLECKLLNVLVNLIDGIFQSYEVRALRHSLVALFSRLIARPRRIPILFCSFLRQVTAHLLFTSLRN